MSNDHGVQNESWDGSCLNTVTLAQDRNRKNARGIVRFLEMNQVSVVVRIRDVGHGQITQRGKHWLQVTEGEGEI
jgi:hypothetical protein